MKTHDRKSIPKGALYLALAGLALANSGCLLAAAGVAGGAAAGYAYCKGKVCETYNANFDDSMAATHTALTELGMPILQTQRDGTSGFIESRTADGDRIRISLRELTSKIPAEGQITRVGVRVATFGDQPVSDRILDQVGLHLAPATASGTQPAPPPATPGVVQTGGTAASAPVGPSSTSVPHQTAPPPLLPPEPVPAGK